MASGAGGLQARTRERRRRERRGREVAAHIRCHPLSAGKGKGWWGQSGDWEMRGRGSGLTGRREGTEGEGLLYTCLPEYRYIVIFKVQTQLMHVRPVRHTSRALSPLITYSQRGNEGKHRPMVEPTTCKTGEPDVDPVWYSDLLQP